MGDAEKDGTEYCCWNFEVHSTLRQTLWRHKPLILTFTKFLTKFCYLGNGKKLLSTVDFSENQF